MEEKSEKEKRIRAITSLYYSNPKIQEALLEFAREREVSPRYYEGFGKRPDILQYQSDIMGLVGKGATSFHCSEEIWNDPLSLSSDITREEMDKLRKNWDLLIDIDSPYFDVSKEAAKLVIELFESYGIKNYGIKFSGSKGFHIIVSGNAFPREHEGVKRENAFPDWPRAITEFIFKEIKPEFRKRVGKIMSFSHLEKNEEPSTRITCKRCNDVALKGSLAKFICPVCNMNVERRDYKANKRRLRCLDEKCAGVLEVMDSKDYFYCENCKDPDNEAIPLSSNRHPESFEEIRGELADEHAELDLVLVAPRHLFRMPYSLHEKTSLVSLVITKDQLNSFELRDADPMKVKVMQYYPSNKEDEGKKLLSDALKWKNANVKQEEKKLMDKYNKAVIEYQEIDSTKVNEKMFPPAIKKLLNGLKDGKKRGLFVLITFFRGIGYSPEKINLDVREWNKKNEPPLKEGYIKSQIDWHLKQKKKIMPPNYSNDSFYKDLGIIDKKPDAKNPLVEVSKAVWRMGNQKHNTQPHL